MIPDNTAGRPLTPGEQAAIADLEQRLLLAAAPDHGRPAGARPRRFGRRTPWRSTVAVPLIALFATACVLVVVAVVAGTGSAGVAAVLASVAATAAAWMLLPARFGGPVRAPRPPFRGRARMRRS